VIIHISPEDGAMIWEHAATMNKRKNHYNNHNMTLKYTIPKLYFHFTLKYIIIQTWFLTVWKSFHKGLENEVLKKIFGSRREKQINVENYITRSSVFQASAAMLM
jgi:hypothetical protein